MGVPGPATWGVVRGVYIGPQQYQDYYVLSRLDKAITIIGWLTFIGCLIMIVLMFNNYGG